MALLFGQEERALNELRPRLGKQPFLIVDESKSDSNMAQQLELFMQPQHRLRLRVELDALAVISQAVIGNTCIIEDESIKVRRN